MNLNRLKAHVNGWFIASTLIISLIVLPNLNIIFRVFDSASENWAHIQKYLLPGYALNTSIIVLFTGLFTLLIGLVSAWLVTAYEFPFRKFFSWGLILPITIPAYIGAYTYQGLFNYTGVIQSFFRNNLGFGTGVNYFDFMNLEGSIFIFTIFLYPYVFIITKSFLKKISASIIESGKLLGRNNLEIFFQIILPISRTALVASVSLVILEVINDYGVVKYYGISTFSTAIFKTWFGMGDIVSAIRLSALLMVFVFLLLSIEKVLRGRKKYSYSSTKIRPMKRQPLVGMKKYLATIFSSIIFSLGFLIPVIQLLYWGHLTYSKVIDIDFILMTMSSISVSVLASILVIVTALIVGNYVRLSNTKISKLYSKIVTIGYSIPGAVIAIVVITLFIFFDRQLSGFYNNISFISGNLLLSTSLFMLIFAYVIRFLAIGYQSIDSGYDRIGNKFTEASRLLGENSLSTFFKVDLPMIKPAIYSGIVLVFIDLVKELPLTLILRPFNFNTLATKSFEYANDEMIHEASIAALSIITISLLAFLSMNRLFKKGAV
jgi:iron(III) transport system permease protein